MPSIISAGTTANTGLNLTADTSGNLVFQTNGNTTAMTIDTSQNVTYANGVSFTGVIGGNGANISSMNASNLTSGTVANARTTAASANGASTIVLRDASGAFSAGIITANGSGLTGISATNITTGTLPKAQLPTGSVLQVIQTVKSDTFSMNTTTFTDITGLSVSITPTSSSSRILVLFSTYMGIAATAAYSGGVRLVRNSTPIFLGASDGFRTQASGWVWNGSSGYNMYSLNGSFLDSPATTSATTYKLQAASGYAGQTVVINRDPNNNNNDYTGVVPSQITVMEIAA